MVNEFDVMGSVDGADGIKRTLENLAKSLPVDQVEPKLMEAAKVIQSVAKANAPRGETGNLVKGIKAKYMDRLGFDRPRSAIAASYAPHDHLVEFGTKPRFNKNGRFTGIMPANPFFRTTVSAYGNDIMKNLISDFSAMLDRGLK